jgi:DNA-directed RNA polymerase specialized sigma24 family protein
MVYDHVTAEAIAEDAVVRALERLEVDRPTNFMAWLFQIARNLCRHFIRDRKSTQRMLENQSRRNARAPLRTPSPARPSRSSTWNSSASPRASAGCFS